MPPAAHYANLHATQSPLSTAEKMILSLNDSAEIPILYGMAVIWITIRSVAMSLQNFEKKNAQIRERFMALKANKPGEAPGPAQPELE